MLKRKGFINGKMMFVCLSSKSFFLPTGRCNCIQEGGGSAPNTLVHTMQVRGLRKARGKRLREGMHASNKSLLGCRISCCCCVQSGALRTYVTKSCLARHGRVTPTQNELRIPWRTSFITFLGARYFVLLHYTDLYADKSTSVFIFPLLCPTNSTKHLACLMIGIRNSERHWHHLYSDPRVASSIETRRHPIVFALRPRRCSKQLSPQIRRMRKVWATWRCCCTDSPAPQRRC